MLFATLETRGNWTKLTFTKTSGSITRDTEKIGQWLTSVSPVTIHVTKITARHILARAPFTLLKCTSTGVMGLHSDCI